MSYILRVAIHANWLLQTQFANRSRPFLPSEPLHKASPPCLPNLIQLFRMPALCQAINLPRSSIRPRKTKLTIYTPRLNVTINACIRKHVHLRCFRPCRPLCLRVSLKAFVTWFFPVSKQRTNAVRLLQAGGSSTQGSSYRDAATARRGPLVSLARYH